MDKYVNADKMLKEYEHSIYDTTDLAEMLYYMPAADVQEILTEEDIGEWCHQHNYEIIPRELFEKKYQHGKWVELPPFKNIYTCSLCGEWGEHHWNYCPHCGAKMDEDEDIPMEYFENGGI